MKRISMLLGAILAFATGVVGQAPPTGQTGLIPIKRPLDVRVERFDITDAILRDGISELSLKNVEDLHLGFEEIIRGKIADDPRTQNPHFSLHLLGKSVPEVLANRTRVTHGPRMGLR